MDDFVIGVISDTHGLVRQAAVEALSGSTLIIHAGDVGDEAVLASLRSVAPVIAVRGNIDKRSWAAKLPQTEIVEVGPVVIYVLHDRKELDLDPWAAGFHAVISGHTHKPSREEHNGVLFLNPGSAGPRRFKLPVSVARLHVQGKSLEAEIIELVV